jgi:bifunctional polynucleotide phosphatase/kinase
MKKKATATKRQLDVQENSSKRVKFDSSAWISYETLIVRDYGFKPSSKLISFDLDGTLIETKNGSRFAQNKDDWKLWNAKIPSVLEDYCSKGYSMVIFTNQGGVGADKVKPDDFKEKVENIQKALNVPLVLIAATENDKYRKPSKGMWEYFKENFSKGKDVELDESFYIGDAAGRPASKSKKKDFSDTDYKFAVNVGLKFNTPEQFFLGEKEEESKTKGGKGNGTSGFDPKKLATSGPILKGHREGEEVEKDTQEVVIFVGSPASGKSTFWKNYLPTYVRVNRDTLKTKEKCVAVLDKSLGEGKSCVVDNTNPEKSDRKLFIDVAKKHKVPVRCFYFNVTKEVATHLDTQRKINEGREHLSKRVGRIPIATFFKKFQPPEKSEEFTNIEEVCFVAKFESDKDKDTFNSLS